MRTISISNLSKFSNHKILNRVFHDIVDEQVTLQKSESNRSVWGDWGGGDWSGGEWSGGEWSGGDWSGADWSGSDWSGSDWSGGDYS